MSAQLAKIRGYLGWMTAAIVVALALATSTAAAAEITKHDLFKGIQEQVLRYEFFTVFDDVNISIADDGVVTLTGSVTGPHKKKSIAKRVATLDGIARLKNEIKVLPVSLLDNELRYRVAHAIYGNSTFWHYAARSNPSIHIVVERGHVTLTGVVDSETDRHLARVLATQFDALSVTNELRLPSEITAELEQLG